VTRCWVSWSVSSRITSLRPASVLGPGGLGSVSQRGRTVASRADPVRACGTSQTGASRRTASGRRPPGHSTKTSAVRPGSRHLLQGHPQTAAL
jgi:hypothetical protein